MPRAHDAAHTALECLRLAHNADRAPEQVVQRATIYYGFVTGESANECLEAVRAALKL